MQGIDILLGSVHPWLPTCSACWVLASLTRGLWPAQSA